MIIVFLKVIHWLTEYREIRRKSPLQCFLWVWIFSLFFPNKECVVVMTCSEHLKLRFCWKSGHPRTLKPDKALKYIKWNFQQMKLEDTKLFSRAYSWNCLLRKPPLKKFTAHVDFSSLSLSCFYLVVKNTVCSILKNLELRIAWAAHKKFLKFHVLNTKTDIKHFWDFIYCQFPLAMQKNAGSPHKHTN